MFAHTEDGVMRITFAWGTVYNNADVEIFVCTLRRHAAMWKM